MKSLVRRTNWLTALWLIVAYFILYFYIRACSLNQTLYSNIAIALIDLSCLVGCYYFIKEHLIPKFLYKKKNLLFILLLLLLMIVFANVMVFLQLGWYELTKLFEWEDLHDTKVLFNPYYQLYDIYIIIFAGCISAISFKLMIDQLMSQNQYAQLQKEKAQTELSFLKAQINPHFLFNSINSIFASIDKNNLEARETVLKFSDMLRYQLYECNTDKISFEKELSYLNNYVELQRLRKEENLSIIIETKGEMNGFEIAPLLLIPFVENAFKYASNHDDAENILKIVLTKGSNFFKFYCMNSKDKYVSRNIIEQGGIGIKNVKRRLELLYPDKHELEITDGEKTFEINLKIEII